MDGLTNAAPLPVPRASVTVFLQGMTPRNSWAARPGKLRESLRSMSSSLRPELPNKSRGDQPKRHQCYALRNPIVSAMIIKE
jgi:hypothetical protein